MLTFHFLLDVITNTELAILIVIHASHIDENTDTIFKNAEQFCCYKFLSIKGNKVITKKNRPFIRIQIETVPMNHLIYISSGGGNLAKFYGAYREWNANTTIKME